MPDSDPPSSHILFVEDTASNKGSWRHWLALNGQRWAVRAVTFAFHAGLLIGIATKPYTRPAFRRFEITLPEHLKQFPNKRITYFRPADLLPAVSPEASTVAEGLTIRMPRPELQTAKITRPDAPPQPQSVESPRPDPTPVESPNFIRPAAPPPKPTRAFVAPPTTPRSAAPALLDLAVTPPVTPMEKPLLAAAPVGAFVPETKFAPKPFVAPPGKGTPSDSKPLVDAPTLPANSATEAVLSINPQGLVPPKLTGNRPASIETGVSQGSGAGRQPGVPVVPGVAIPGSARPANPPPVNLPERVVRPAPMDAVRAAPDLTASEVSIGHGPGMRSLPASVEAVFATRTVYTTNLTVPVDQGGRAATQEWTVWFAEPPGAPAARLMRPPKLALRMPPATRSGPGRIFVVTRLSAEGVLKVQAPPSGNGALVQILESWQFRPAQRGNLPVEVDFVLEILP